MNEWGHHAARIPGGGFIDCWGSGPYTIEHNGSAWRFEDSARFGPVVVKKDGDTSRRQPGEHSKFWKAHAEWVRCGRRVTESGVCILERLDLDALGLTDAQ